MTGRMLCMSELGPGMSGEVVKLHHAEKMKRRLLDLGLIEGSLVTCVGRSFWGDPSAYLICGAVVALRKSDCEQILLRETGV